MGSIDTRLHRLEAMVAGLLASDNLNTERLKELAGELARVELTAAWHDPQLEERVAALEQFARHWCRDNDPGEEEVLDHMLEEAGGPEPAAPAQAACPICGKTRLDTYWGPEACQCPRPKQAAQPSLGDRFVAHIQQHLKPGQVVICKICGKTVDEIAAAQPAPQQPRSCDTCKWDIRLWHKKPRPQGHCSKCKSGHEPDSWDGWQPRGGGG